MILHPILFFLFSLSSDMTSVDLQQATQTSNLAFDILFTIDAAIYLFCSIRDMRAGAEEDVGAKEGDVSFEWDHSFVSLGKE